MGQRYPELDARLSAFIARQKMFFVATAPSGPGGHVNVSPKGLDTFRILGPTTVAFLDIGGSGIETVAHLRENGRITFLFCALEGPPSILRLYGQGRSVCFDEPGFEAALADFPTVTRARAVVTVELDRIQDSCGYGVALYTFEGERDQLERMNAARTDAEWAARRYAGNTTSLDGLPGLLNGPDGPTRRPGA